ncbi:MAG: DUF1697 domain-containing protein [Burkholderiales bacterium]|nr:DUF1697 domain-containing protein [Burkholderiales bacterium]
MTRFAAFLRGVSPTNCKMPELARSFVAAGFTDVKTVLSSGNVVFTASGTERSVLKKAQAAMQEHLDNPFKLFVRRVDVLQAMLASDPYAAFKLKPDAKRVVTFLPAEPAAVPKLPIELDGARILCLKDRALFSAYLPSPKSPVFMVLIERTFGKEVTTRTWETVRKVCAASDNMAGA